MSGTMTGCKRIWFVCAHCMQRHSRIMFCSLLLHLDLFLAAFSCIYLARLYDIIWYIYNVYIESVVKSFILSRGLYNKVHITNHPLHHLLPPPSAASQSSYDPRSRGHSLSLLNASNLFRKSLFYPMFVQVYIIVYIIIFLISWLELFTDYYHWRMEQ